MVSSIHYDYLLCAYLTFLGSFMHIHVGATARTNIYGEGIGPIYGYSCRGNEDSLSRCSAISYSTIVSCSHSRDIGVDCEGQILLVL